MKIRPVVPGPRIPPELDVALVVRNAKCLARSQNLLIETSDMAQGKYFLLGRTPADTALWNRRQSRTDANGVVKMRATRPMPRGESSNLGGTRFHSQ